MKTIITLLALVLAIPLSAQIRVPASVAGPDQIDALREEAAAEGRVLIFIMVNPNATQQHVADAFQEYHRRFRGYGPVILLAPNVNVPNLPAGAAQGFASLRGGFPRLVAVDPTDDSLIEAVPYLSVADRDRALRNHRRVVSAHVREARREARRRPPVVPTPPWQAPPPEPPPGPPPAPSGE